MTFEEFLKKEGIAMTPWQKQAINNFLKDMYPVRGRAAGKTFIIKKLSEFISRHGNDYEMR